MPNFDPAQPLPPDLETQPITVAGNSLPANIGGGFTGMPSDVDPNQTSVNEANAAAAGQAGLDAFNAAHPAIQGDVATAGPQGHPVANEIAARALATLPPGETHNVDLAPPPAPGPGPGPQQHPAADAIRARVGVTAGQPAAAVPGPDDLIAPNLGPKTPAEETALAGAEKVKLAQDAVQIARDEAASKEQQAQLKLDEHNRQIEENNRQQQINDQAYARATAERDQALREVKNFTFQDYFDKEGHDKPLSMISVFLGGLGAHYSGGQNPALENLRANIKQDFASQEAELKKRQDIVAETQQGVSNVELHNNREWEALKYRQGAQYTAVADQIEKMAAQAKGKVDINAAQMAVQDFRQQAVNLTQKTIKDSFETKKLEEEIKHYGFQNKLLTAQTAEAYARAAKERAIAGGTTAADKSAIKDTEVTLKDAEKRLNGTGTQMGPGKAYDKIVSTRAALANALQSNDPKELAAAALQFKESIGPIIAGGRTTRFLGQAVDNQKTLDDKFREAVGKISGNATAGKKLIRQFIADTNTAAEIEKAAINGIYTDTNEKLHGQGGVASTPAAKERAQNGLRSLVGRVPGYENLPGSAAGLTPTPQPQQAGHAPTGTPVHKGAATAYLQPDGTLLDANGRVIAK